MQRSQRQGGRHGGRPLQRNGTAAPRLKRPPSLAAHFRVGTAIAVVVLLAACGTGEARPGDGTERERAMTVSTFELVPERVVETARLPADLAPLRRAVLASEVEGQVERVQVDSGDRVAAGDLLVAVDIRALEQALAEAEAVADRARFQAERAEGLFERRSITRQQLIDARSERDVAEARLASARLRRDKAEIRAPWAGRVAARRVEVGDYVAPGQPVVELVDVSRLKVLAPAPAADVPFLEVGKPVRLSVDVFPDLAVEGRIVRLAPELDPAARTLEVEARIDNPGGRLRPGLAARIEVPRRTFEEAIVIPAAAVIDFESRRVVYVVEDGVARRRDVELGPRLGERVVALSGLAAGERLIVRGQGRVSDGQRVVETG